MLVDYTAPLETTLMHVTNFFGETSSITNVQEDAPAVDTLPAEHKDDFPRDRNKNKNASDFLKEVGHCKALLSLTSPVMMTAKQNRVYNGLCF